jgi:RsiW-degrading membrane proteinase PrsW (M82 family)
MEVIIFSLLPAIVYAFIIYLSTPYRAVSFVTGLSYWSVGFLSVLFVYGFHHLAPSLSKTMFPPPVGLFFLAFVQIALVEEVSKYLSFRILNISRKENDTSVAVMFYAMMTAAGFAVIENYFYAESYGKAVLFYRSFSSVLLHMICGLFMGYFIARGRENTDVQHYTVFEIFLKRKPRWRKTIYTTLGILAAVATHGIFDYLIILDPKKAEDKILIMIIAGLWVSFLIGRSLSKNYVVKDE